MTTLTGRPIALAASDTWKEEAVCRTIDPELFFPEGRGAQLEVMTEDAKAVCIGGCPVRAECLEFALETRQDSGVWGGLSEHERKVLVRKKTRLRLRPARPSPQWNVIEESAEQVRARLLEVAAGDIEGVTHEPVRLER